jgi:hypothetical protein
MSSGIPLVEAMIVGQLPGYEAAWIPMPKLTDYVLSPDSEEGRGKAIIFASALGIKREHSGYLHDQILIGLTEAPAILHEETQYGPTWEVPILVTGLNGRVGYVRTGWIIRPDDSGPQLTTARVAKPCEIPRLRAAREAFGYATM